jgi:hypothetical protein
MAMEPEKQQRIDEAEELRKAFLREERARAERDREKANRENDKKS